LIDSRSRFRWVGSRFECNVAAPRHDRTYEDRTYKDLLLACARAVGIAPEITWVDEQWLVGRGVRQWTELPLWRAPAARRRPSGRPAPRTGYPKTCSANR
jgi:hypothetical protein